PERMTSQINGLNQAVRNANDGISLSQTAEGDLVQITNNLQRMRELAVQASNATNSSSDRAALNQEVTQLSQEIDRVAKASSFNGVKLLDGTFTTQTFQVGANNTSNDQISVASLVNAKASVLGQFNGFNSSALGAITNGAATNLSITLTGPGTVYNLGNVATDASAIANAINASGINGLTASAAVNTAAAGTSAVTATAVGSSTFTLNGLTITVANTGTTAAALPGNRANTVAAINAQSASTGVTATDNGSGVVLSAADGRNIVLAGFAAGSATAATLADYGLGGVGTTTGTVNATYVMPSGSAVSSVVFTDTAIGGSPVTKTVATTGTAISAIDVTTAANATAALTSIDAALASVSSGRATLGALQNRFMSVVSSLQVTSENLSASRSRIQDTDFAAETAILTRAQILQQ